MRPNHLTMKFYTKEQTDTLHDQTFAYTIVKDEDHVLTIRLNRPEKRNAFKPQMVNEIVYALAYAHYNNDIWAVVIEGEGKVFCAGADLKAFMNPTDDSDSTIPKPQVDITIGDAFKTLYKPCIAKVDAPVYAGGFLILGGCTHVLASEKASFGLPEVKRGLWPMQVMASLCEVMPNRKALDMCIRGKSLDVKEAFESGIVTQITADIDASVDSLINDIKENSPAAIRLGLKAYDEMKSKSSDEQHHYLRMMLMNVLQTKDAREGIAAFKEKREPKWVGE